MFGDTPIFIRIGRYGRSLAGFAGGIGAWLLIAPGLALIGLGLAILIWPELLAYLVALFLLVAGITLVTWGWALYQAERRAARRLYQDGNTTYRVYTTRSHYP